jgi:hypothetical protein
MDLREIREFKLLFNPLPNRKMLIFWGLKKASHKKRKFIFPLFSIT